MNLVETRFFLVYPLLILFHDESSIHNSCEFKGTAFLERIELLSALLIQLWRLTSLLTFHFCNFSFCFQHRVDFLHLMINAHNNSKDKESHKGKQALPGLWRRKLSGSGWIAQNICKEAFLGRGIPLLSCWKTDKAIINIEFSGCTWSKVCS